MIDPTKEQVERKQLAEQERQKYVRAFRKVFGSEDSERTPEQKTVWKVLQTRIDAPVFEAYSGKIDTHIAATNEGQRIFASQCVKLATTPIVEQVEKPAVKK